MATARTAQTETRLKDGRVLIAGGCSDQNRPVSSAELYDPGTGSFSSTGSMATVRCYSTATLLLSGKVLLAGGDDYWYGTSAELYDPATGTFSATGSMAFGRLGQAATMLPDGNVLVSGGNGEMNQAVEVYDPSAGRFSLAPFILPVSVERSGDSTTLLRSGKVLIAGGGTDVLTGGNVSTADLYDPATSAFSSTGAMVDHSVRGQRHPAGRWPGPGRRGRTTAQLRRLGFVGVGGAVYAITEGFAAGTRRPATHPGGRPAREAS